MIPKPVFAGYEEVLNQFWGEIDETATPEVRASKWWNSPVVFVNCEESSQDHPLVQFLAAGVNDCEEVTVVLGGKSYEIFTIDDSEGWVSCLLLESDYIEIAQSCGLLVLCS